MPFVSSHHFLEGEFEERLTLGAARQLYAGVCRFDPHALQLKALGVLLVLVDTWLSKCEAVPLISID